MKDHLKKYIDHSKTAEVRGLRILLEYFYATEIFEKITRHKAKIISVFGSARTMPDTREYKLAYELGSLLYQSGFAVVTGASRGIMEAANQGVADAIATQIHKKNKKISSLESARKTSLYEKLLKLHSVGLNISLPMESKNNSFVGVSATFHYFMVRKFFFGTLSSGFVACEGGWGTRDELFEILTLVQTGKSPVMPIVYLSSDPKHLAEDLKHTLAKNYISLEDMSLIRLVKTPKAAAEEIQKFYRRIDEVSYERDQVVKITLKESIPEEKKKRVEKLLMKGHESPMSIQWHERSLILSGYAPCSYGTLRRAIDLMNSD